MQLTCTWWFVFSLYLVTYQQYKVPFPNQMTITGALMEYAAILLLLKKRRRPVRSVDEGLKSVLAIVQPGAENGEINPQRPHRRKVDGTKVETFLVMLNFIF